MKTGNVECENGLEKFVGNEDWKLNWKNLLEIRTENEYWK
jgi:hypothetical protein